MYKKTMVKIIAEVSSEITVFRRQKKIVLTVLSEGKTCHQEIYNQEKYHFRVKVKKTAF